MSNLPLTHSRWKKIAWGIAGMLSMVASLLVILLAPLILFGAWFPRVWHHPQGRVWLSVMGLLGGLWLLIVLDAAGKQRFLRHQDCHAVYDFTGPAANLGFAGWTVTQPPPAALGYATAQPRLVYLCAEGAVYER